MSTPRRLTEGDTAPDFTLPDADGTPVTLSDHRGRRVILYFYPAAMTPGCTKEAIDFRDSLPALTEGGYDVLGISPDPPERLAEFRDREDLTFCLLSDVERSVMTTYGAFGTKQLYGREVIGVIRSTFVVGEDGVITQASYGIRATGHVASLRQSLNV
ncbi:MAG: thioredoxin-dependent thiol peroxidase [Mycobacteriales bacterium]